jgi:hypothetical protein
MTYEYDIFLSYTTHGTDQWVRQTFFPVLHNCLMNTMPRDPVFFVDWEMDPGTEWPKRLAYALNRSRIMISVLSPPYFRSRWCIAEWETILARQKRVTTGKEQQDYSLVLPVVFADGEHFPQNAKNITHFDLSRWSASMTYDGFRSTPDFLGFDRELKKIAELAAALLRSVPEWDETWPVHRPNHFPRLEPTCPGCRSP